MHGGGAFSFIFFGWDGRIPAFYGRMHLVGGKSSLFVAHLIKIFLQSTFMCACEKGACVSSMLG